jgi:Xaa-Pro aminopeptidase
MNGGCSKQSPTQKEELIMTLNGGRFADLRAEFTKVEKVLADTPSVDALFSLPTEEFVARQQKTYEALRQRGASVGVVFSNEQYDGDVPYLGGNSNVHVEQVGGVIGKTGFHVLTGLEGCYVAEQLSRRALAKVDKVEFFKLAGEEYPIQPVPLEQVVEAAAGGKVHQVALLTPREVIPAALVNQLESAYGRENVIDLQEAYQRIKYEKSENEMRLIRDATVIADAMLRAMLAVLKPGKMETQVAAWGYFVARELGAEEMGWDVSVCANTANRTLIGKALNRVIQEGDYVLLGAGPKRDGLNSCVRRSCVAVANPRQVSADQRFWLQFIEEAYKTGLKALQEVAANKSPAYLAERALVDFFKWKGTEVSQRLGKKIALERFKPYSSVHNTGYTECQEFFGNVTLNSSDPLGDRVALMLDVALRGIGESWDDVVIPGMDFVVVENTCGKFGPRLEEFNTLPYNVQELVGANLT